MITFERSQVLNAYLEKNESRIAELMEMEPKDALVIINAAGHDFTVEELTSYCDAIKNAVNKSQEGELSEDALDEVAGGVVPLILFGVAAGIAIMAVGINQVKKSSFKW